MTTGETQTQQQHTNTTLKLGNKKKRNAKKKQTRKLQTNRQTAIYTENK